MNHGPTVKELKFTLGYTFNPLFAIHGEDPPDFSEKGGALAPLAKFSKEGSLIWDDDLCAKIVAMTKKN